MERSGTQGRKLGAGVPASGLQQWKLQAPGKETQTEAQGEENRVREGTRNRGRDTEKQREIAKVTEKDRNKDRKRNSDRDTERKSNRKVLRRK